MLVLPFAAARRAPRSVAILGNAAGTTARAYGHYFPRARVDGVEIDGGADRRSAASCSTCAARGYGCTRPTRGRSCAARSAAATSIVVDAYRQPYIPFYLTTREFFELVRERLEPGGVVARQRRSPRGLRQPGAGAVGDHGRASSQTVLRDPVQGHERRAARDDGKRLGAAAAGRRAVAARGPAARRGRRGGRARGPRCAAGASTPTTCAPVEWLVDASILQVAAHGER